MRNQTARLVFDNMDEKKSNGSILRKPGSKKLYILFLYMGRRIEKSTGIDDTPANRRKVRGWLDRQAEKMDQGTFSFAEAFPAASDGEKRWFATKEGWEYNPEPGQVLFGEYLERWMIEVWEKFPSKGKKLDYRNAIDPWLKPHFKDLTFHQITGVEVRSFLMELKQKEGRREGQPLSGSRVRNILVAFRAIWSDACEEHRWNLPDPFRFSARRLPPKNRRRPPVFRFEEWEKVLSCIDPFYKPVAELMVLTGLIASEVAGLRREDIKDGRMLVRNSIVRGQAKETLKTVYRIRSIPLTASIKRVLDEAPAPPYSPNLFTMRNGGTFSGNNFRYRVWLGALSKAGLDYRVPYVTRHTYAAWALTIGMNPTRLVRLMGHGSKQMVYEVYGDYVEGLEQDAERIRGYFGPDF